MTESSQHTMETNPQEPLSTTDVICKLQTLLHCGNDRVELAAAKELLSVFENEARQQDRTQDVRLEVDIRIVEPKESDDENHTS